MPKEKINDESDVVAECRWSHDQYVQVATLSTNPKQFIEWCRSLVARYDETQMMSAPAMALPHISGPDRLVDGSSLGMFWTPNRYQINELIRVLRRARDQAFGRDE